MVPWSPTAYVLQRNHQNEGSQDALDTMAAHSLEPSCPRQRGRAGRATRLFNPGASKARTEEHEFGQPPEGAADAWWGPSISATTAKCRHVEPDDPQTPVGGIHGEQFVTSVIRLPREIVERRDKNFEQGMLQWLSRGGRKSDLEPGDLPTGVFLAARGHPIFKVNAVELDTANILAGGGPALVVTAEFVHEPRMGECYFYLAAWVALD